MTSCDHVGCVFWDMKLCIAVDIYESFRGTSCPLLQGRRVNRVGGGGRSVIQGSEEKTGCMIEPMEVNKVNMYYLL
jgi:hypothetical protein